MQYCDEGSATLMRQRWPDLLVGHRYVRLRLE